MKKIFSIFLAILITVSCFFICGVNSNAAATSPIPTIQICGQGGSLYLDKNSNMYSEKIYPLDLSKDVLLEYASSLNKPFAIGLATDDWTQWCDTFVGICTDIFEPIALDKEGNPIGDTGVTKFNYAQDFQDEYGNYKIGTYNYRYDWRLDPEDVIDQLHQDIQLVLKITGAPKVNLLSRCIGANVALAYLNKYGNSLINHVILYCVGIDGFELIGRIFTGDMTFDKDAISRFADNYLETLEFDNPDVADLLVELFNIYNTTNSLDNMVNGFETIYSKVYQNVIPRILRETLGRYGTFWALISDEYYEDAKKFIFGGYEDEYAVLIKKLDYTHYNTTNKARETILKTIDDGTGISIIAKYGLQIAPVVEDTYIQSDSVLELVSATGGATCSTVTGTLSLEYISQAKELGTYKYISPDMQVDASTAFLPDHTWFIKNCTHMNMPKCVNELIGAILSYDGYMTVFDDEDYPQYMLYDRDSDSITPLTVENSDTNVEWEEKSFLERIFSMFKLLFRVIINAIFKK